MRPSTAWIVRCSLLGFWIVAGCSFDQSGVSPSNDIDAGTGSPTPDAAVVGCISSADCASPPSLCLQPGTCGSDGQCVFPEVDCSAMNGACTAGACDPATGTCAAVAANEGAVCDAPLVGEWSECMTDQSCSTSGQRKRLVSQQLCSFGTCQPDDATEESQSCNIPPQDVEGTPCGAPPSCGGWGDCEPSGWGDQCSTEGQRWRQCSGSACTFLGTCEADTWEEPQSCVLDTDGEDCWGCWSNGNPTQDCECHMGQCKPAMD